MIAAVASSLLYFFGLSAPSAAQDFYAYTRLVAVQPATWLATALVLGGLRNLHIHQSKELADQLAASRRRANDLSSGLERAAAEISQLERRIALDMSTAAALSRSFSLIDMGSRWAAARSYGELFRVATGAATFTIYLANRDGFVPAWAIEEDTIRSTKSIEPLSATEIDAMMVEKAGREGTADVDESESVVGRHVVRVPPLDSGSKPLAIVVCDLNPSLDTSEFLRRADETSRAFATILRACPDSPSGARP
jgi:hypothetical protein